MTAIEHTAAGGHDGDGGFARYIGSGGLPYSPVTTHNPSKETPKQKDNAWRPFTLRLPTLVLFLLTTIGLIAAIEALNLISNRNGALTFAYYNSPIWSPDPSSGFSVAQIFCYRYLPQLVIVSYGIAWAAVDLDVKRLEPYFQLSEPGGASASDSILLHYPFDFLALVPITSARRRSATPASRFGILADRHRRHWSVFAAGMALVLIFWVITPLQSSLLTMKLVLREIPTQFKPMAKLGTFSSQRETLDSSFLDSVYGVAWLGEELAEFMTKEFVAMPFKVDDGQIDFGPLYEIFSIAAVTRVYQTHLDCVPATIIEPGKNDNGAYNFTTENCFYRVDPLPSKYASRNLMYIGHSNNGGTMERHLRKSECPVKNIFLGVWAESRLSSSRSTDIDVSGVFCHTKYSYSNAEITVNYGSFKITNFSFIGEPKPLTTEGGILDIDFFEQYLGAGSILESYSPSRTPSAAIAPRFRYGYWGLWDPTRQVGYAIGLENKTFDSFKDPQVFGDAMNKTHKLLFNYALYSLLNNSFEGSYELTNGTLTAGKYGVVVIPAVAHLLAGFLLLVAICLTGELLLSYNRCYNLSSDPDSLATKMSLVSRSPQLLRDFEGTDDSPDIRRSIVERRRYKLGPWYGDDGPRLDILDAADVTPEDGFRESSTKSQNGQGVRPWELSVGMGVGTTVFSAGLLVLLAILFRSSQKNSGLPTLSSRELTVRFIYSFIPTVAATLIEPVWVVITRYLSLYQPWTELNRGQSTSSASLGLTYTNLPPVLIAPRALAGGNFILFLASALVLASNGLAVALGGLFDTSLRDTNNTMTFELPLSSSIDTQIQTTERGIKTTLADVSETFAVDGEEHWMIAKLFETTPWTERGFYFLPFEWNKTARSELNSASARTRGFGVDLTCELLEGDVYGQQSWAGVSGGSVPKPAAALNVTIPTADGGVIRCNNPLVEFTVDSLKTGHFAGEYLYGLGPTDRVDKEAEDFCNSLIVVGWSRGEITVGERNDSTASYTMDMSTYANTTILCIQRISSAEFNVVLDARDNPSPHRLTPFTYDDSSFFNHSTTITSFKSQLSTIIRTNPFNGRDTGGMHNDISPNTLPHSLMDFLRSEQGQSSLSLPDTPPPSFEDAQTTFQDFYSWMAAIVISQNSERIFRSTTKDGGKKPQTSGWISYQQSRVSMDPVMFYIATALLGFSTIASLIIFTARPKRFMPRLPNTLAAEIGFFYASEALKDTAGTASMTSALRERHLANLGWKYGYGKFMGKDGNVHLGVERMGPIRDFKEAS